MTRVRALLVGALGVALAVVVGRGWVRLGEVEADLLAADRELADRD